jgi:hypothetical protein
MERIVSTYNPADWGTHVQRNVESWLERTAFEVVLYHEGERPDFRHDRLVWRQWEDIPGAVAFTEEAKSFPPACGRFGRHYDYNYDAAKFSRKVFAQCDAAEEDADLLVWLDSDVFIAEPLFSRVLYDQLLACPMAIYERRGYHTETGVVLWDMKREECAEFFQGYRALFDNRRVYCLARGWHDCWAMDFVIAQLRMPIADLGPGGDYSSPHANLEVVSRSELGHFLRHDKGMRKYAA